MRVYSDIVREGLSRMQRSAKITAAAADADGFSEAKSFVQTYEHPFIRASVLGQRPR